MNKAIGFVSAVILAASLTGCATDGAGSDISEPGTDVTQRPTAPSFTPPCGHYHRRGAACPQ